MEPLAYTTSKISWLILFSAISNARKEPRNIDTIDLNMQAIPSIILSCTALESFVNEISSLSKAFMFNFEKEYNAQFLEIDKQESTIGISWDKCKRLAEIKNDSKGSFYDRYKLLVKTLDVKSPEFIQTLSKLKDLRDDLVHFKILDMSVVENSDGVITYFQQPPEVFSHLKKYKVKNYPVIALDGNDNSIDWSHRISTNAMAIWCIDLVLDSLIYVLESIQNGRFKDFLVKAYSTRDGSFEYLFQKGKSDIELWTKEVFLS